MVEYYPWVIGFRLLLPIFIPAYLIGENFVPYIIPIGTIFVSYPNPNREIPHGLGHVRFNHNPCGLGEIEWV
jgi:hypothetical protein